MEILEYIWYSIIGIFAVHALVEIVKSEIIWNQESKTNK